MNGRELVRNEESSFCISIDFERGTEDPARVFRAASGLIDAFGEFDKSLARSVHSKIDPVLLLEDVETGSIKVWLRNRLSELDDEAIKDLQWKKQMGAYLVKAKYLAIDFIDKRTTISDRKELEDLQVKLLEAAKETDIIHVPSYTPLALPDLAGNISNVSSALTHLSEHDKASLETPYGTTGFNLTFNCIPEKIEELITESVITSQVDMIIKVKKPDYLGDSKWEFRHGHNSFSAKINHEAWLRDFQDRKIDIRPGDALKALVKVVVKYDSNMEVISELKTIEHVDSVIPGISPTQESITD